jgi:DNA-3-methyladenine glycosylase I
MDKKRCAWVNSRLSIKYHDDEWCVPVHDDRKLFELLILEGAQAGLSWETVLKKRKNYKLAFDNFIPELVSKYDDEKIKKLCENPGIIRNRLKINSAVRNAKVFLEIKKDIGSFDKYLWGFVNNKQIQNGFNNLSEIPAKTELSENISKDLKKRGMNFVGPTIIYAYMQAVGMVNDHTTDCFRYREIKNKK